VGSIKPKNRLGGVGELRSARSLKEKLGLSGRIYITDRTAQHRATGSGSWTGSALEQEIKRRRGRVVVAAPTADRPPASLFKGEEARRDSGN